VSGVGQEHVEGVANVGTRPTVNDSIKANLEVHILDGDVDLYGRRIEVTFRHKLRDEQKFESIDELVKNITRDVENAREWFRL
jgi:riboflavin kinase/FMN adenylyltransferase